MRGQSERQLLDTVRACAMVYGWTVYHTYDSRRSEPGFPDLVMVRGGRLIFAELKSDVGKLTSPQKHWISALSLVADTPEVYVWRPVDRHRITRTLGRTTNAVQGA